MTTMDKVIVGISIACLIGAVLYQCMLAMRVKAGLAGEHKRVSKILRSYAKLRGAQVIDDAVLVNDGLSGWADHILIGYFGVLLVYDLTYPGIYSGKADDESWTVALDDSVGRIKNPFPIAGQCAGRVNTLLKKEGIKVTVERAAVLTGRGRKRTQTYVMSEDVVLLRNLRGYLNKTKFDEDRDVAIDKVAAALKAGLKQPEPVPEKQPETKPEQEKQPEQKA